MPDYYGDSCDLPNSKRSITLPRKLLFNLMHFMTSDCQEVRNEDGNNDNHTDEHVHDNCIRNQVISEEKYRNVVENSLDAIFIVQDHRIVFANKRIESLTDYSKYQVMNFNDIFSLVIDIDRDRVLEHFDSITSNNPRWCEFRIQTKNSGIKWIETNAIEVNYNGRKAVQFAARDITKQRNLEQKMIQAQKLESIDRLASGLAHDFNNLLGGIMGVTLNLLEKTKDNDLFRKDIEYIHDVTKEGAELVRDLLSFCKINEDKYDRVNVNQIINKVVALIRRTITPTIELNLNLSPTLSQIEADSTQIQQAIMNMCMNARDAMQENGVLAIKTDNVTITGQERYLPLNPGQYIKISIRDTGMGMDENIQRRIFEPFFTTKDKGHGTGLGLTIVYGVIKRHNGHIDVDSKVGEYTRFNMYLPIVHPHHDNIYETKNVTIDKEFIDKFLKPTQNFHKGSIAILENEENSCKTAQKFLRSANFNVIVLHDLQQLFELMYAKDDDLKLALIDEHTLVHSINELKQVCASNQWNLPILIGLHMFERDKIENIEKIENCSYIQKPYLYYDLLQHVKNSLSMQ